MPTRQSAISHAIANAASRRLLRKNRKDVPIRLAESVEDMTSAFKRLHNQYKLKGYQEQNEHGQRVIPANLLPTSYTFLSEDQGTTNGTVTLIEDGVAGLPADEMYKSDGDGL